MFVTYFARVPHFSGDNQGDAKATRQACSADLPVRNMREACKMHVRDIRRVRVPKFENPTLFYLTPNPNSRGKPYPF